MFSNRIKLIALTAAISTLFMAVAAYAATNDLTITTSIDKSSYDYTEPIQVVMEAENVTGADISLSFSSGCQMNFAIYRFDEAVGTYTIPVYNEDLYPRNCDSTATDITIPNGRKAIWTRTFDPAEVQYPDLVPGDYILHGFIVENDNEDWSYQETSYIAFSVVQNVNGPTPPEYDELYWSEQLCLGTGGTFDSDCTCDANSAWSETAGCTETITLDELCVETSGVLPEGNGVPCYCGDLYWNSTVGCNAEPNVDPNAIVPFNDIEGHWGEAYIIALQEDYVVTGYEDGGFHPDDYINRAELVKMALSAANIPATDPVSESGFLFNDLDAWQIPWVYAAWDQSIVEGYDETTFAPAQNVTRAEALKIAMLAFVIDIPDTSDEWAFEDTVEHWAISYINQAYLDFIVSGHEDGNFYPNDSIRRAEAAKIIQLLSGI